MVDTYNIKPHQKLNVTIEEVSYLLSKNGDIYDSVKDITTDGTGAVLPSEPLPTPTDDGAVNGYKDETTITPSSNQSNTIIEEEIELSNEELADLMVQAMSSEAYFDNDNSYTYRG